MVLAALLCTAEGVISGLLNNDVPLHRLFPKHAEELRKAAAAQPTQHQLMMMSQHQMSQSAAGAGAAQAGKGAPVGMTQELMSHAGTSSSHQAAGRGQQSLSVRPVMPLRPPSPRPLDPAALRNPELYAQKPADPRRKHGHNMADAQLQASAQHQPHSQTYMNDVDSGLG